MINKNLKELYKKVCKQNDKHIKEGEKINAVAFIVDEDKKIQVGGLFFEGSEEKKYIINKLKEVIAKTKTIGYVLILDTKLTEINTKTGKIIPRDAVLRTLYTPKDKISEAVIYKDNRIIERRKVQGRDNLTDKWDYWATKEMEMSKEDLEKYNKFKEEHKEDYKDV